MAEALKLIVEKETENDGNHNGKQTVTEEARLVQTVLQEMSTGSDDSPLPGMRNQSLEQMIFQGESIPAMAAAENVLRGSVHNYMKVRHAVKTSEGHTTHYGRRCDNTSHDSLHKVWNVKRAKRLARESAKKERIKKREMQKHITKTTLCPLSLLKGYTAYCKTTGDLQTTVNAERGTALRTRLA